MNQLANMVDNWDNDDTGYDYVTGEFVINNAVSYRYTAKVRTYRNIPCSADVVQLHRYQWNAIAPLEKVNPGDYPEAICAAIVKHVLEMR